MKYEAKETVLFTERPRETMLFKLNSINNNQVQSLKFSWSRSIELDWIRTLYIFLQLHFLFFASLNEWLIHKSFEKNKALRQLASLLWNQPLVSICVILNNLDRWSRGLIFIQWHWRNHICTLPIGINDYSHKEFRVFQNTGLNFYGLFCLGTKEKSNHKLNCTISITIISWDL